MIYVASRTYHAPMWRAMRAAGLSTNSTWIDEAGPSESNDLRDLWKRICKEIRAADGLILYVESQDFPLKGALVEVGYALGMHIPICIVTGDDIQIDKQTRRPFGSWIDLPQVQFFTRIDMAAKYIAGVA